MGWFDDVSKWLRGARRKAATEAGKAAARQTARRARDAVEEAGDEVLDAAEAELETARAARKGRVEVAPSHAEADAIAARVLGAAEASEGARAHLRGRSQPSSEPDAEDAQDAAQAELARLKAQLRRELYGEE